MFARALTDAKGYSQVNRENTLIVRKGAIKRGPSTAFVVRFADDKLRSG